MTKFSVALGTTATQAQDNAVGMLRPYDIALKNLGLNPVDGSFVSNDQLLLFDNSQPGFDKAPSAIYTYNTQIGNNGGWRLTGGGTNDHGDDLIVAGSAMIIRKAATATGQTVFWSNAPLQPVSSVSRKNHGMGNFDVPLTGNPSIECRSAGPNNSYQVLFTFPSAVTFNSASISSGNGSVSDATGNGTTTATVNLTGVTNAQRITISLLGVSNGTFTNDVELSMGVLIGDTSGNGSVNSSDVSQVKAQSGHGVTGVNYREDLTVNGTINSSDVSLEKRDQVRPCHSRRGTAPDVDAF